MNYAREFARSCGCKTSDPALLAMYEAIRQSGIREARAAHFERVELVQFYAKHPAAFFAAIRPSLCSSEFIEDAAKYIANFKNLPTWRQNTRIDVLRQVKQLRVIARYFRRFGRRIWINQNQEVAA